MIVNELLTYIKFYINSSAVENIKKVVQNFYSEDEVVQAKRTLWDHSCSKWLSKYPERKSSDIRPAKIPHIEDIIDALKKLDASDKLPDILARNIDRLPDRQPEEMNLLAVVQRISNLEKSVKTHDDTLSELKIDVMNIKDNGATHKLPNSNVVTRDSKKNNKGNDNENNNDNVNENERENANVNKEKTISSSGEMTVLKKSPPSTQGNSDEGAMEAGRLVGGNSTVGPLPREVYQPPGPSKQQLPQKPDKEWLQADGYNMVMSRNRRKKIIGCGNGSTSGLKGAPLPQKKIWISRVVEGNEKMITDFLKENQVSISCSEKVSHPDAKFASFKISIGAQDLGKVMDSNFWPDGIVCQVWREFKEKKYKPDVPVPAGVSHSNEKEIENIHKIVEEMKNRSYPNSDVNVEQ